MRRSSRKGFVASSAERCVGPLTGRVRHPAGGLIGRRAEAGCRGGEAQVGENLPDDRLVLNHGDDFHRPAAPGTEVRINLVDLAEQPRPRSASLQGHSRPVIIGGWVRGFGFRERPVPLAVAAGPIRLMLARAIAKPLDVGKERLIFDNFLRDFFHTAHWFSSLLSLWLLQLFADPDHVCDTESFPFQSRVSVALRFPCVEPAASVTSGRFRCFLCCRCWRLLS